MDFRVFIVWRGLREDGDYHETPEKTVRHKEYRKVTLNEQINSQRSRFETRPILVLGIQ